MSYYGKSLRAFAVEGIPLIEMGQDIVPPLIKALDGMNETLRDNDVVIVASKIVSKAENRIVDLREIEPSDKAIRLSKMVDKRLELIELILQQGKLIGFSRKHILIEYESGFVGVDAAIDGGGRGGAVSSDLNIAVLLPKNPDKSAASIRENLKNYYKTNFGLIIQDTAGRSWRRGHIGLCIGSSGIKVIDNIFEDSKRRLDLYGVTTTVAAVNIGDQLASIGNLLMGETNNGTPVVIVRGLNVVDESQSSKILNNTSIQIRENDDLQKAAAFVEVSPGIYHRKI